jgi:hypothetical protein
MSTGRTLLVNGRDYRWPVQPLVVVCLDGSSFDYVREAIAAGVAPYLGALLARGFIETVDAAACTWHRVETFRARSIGCASSRASTSYCLATRHAASSSCRPIASATSCYAQTPRRWWAHGHPTTICRSCARRCDRTVGSRSARCRCCSTDRLTASAVGRRETTTRFGSASTRSESPRSRGIASD